MFDDRLKKLREDKGLNMSQAAKQLNFSYTTYVSYEKNEREPNSETLIMLADFFECSTDYLIGRSPKVKMLDFNENYLNLNSHERKVVTAYRQQPKMQPAVDRLLGIDDEYVSVPMAARAEDNKPLDDTHISKSKLNELAAADSDENDVDL
jgi:transcriptional regulator with XRE-family HTH domain